MPVVKSQHTKELQQSAIVMDLGDIEQYAAELVTRAKKEAQEIIQASRVKAEMESREIREAARKTGHEEGMQTGMEQGQKLGHDEAVKQAGPKLLNLVNQWNAALQHFNANLPTHFADARTDMVRLALAIAARVTREETLRNRQIAPATLEAALKLVSQGRAVSIRASAEDTEELKKYVPQLLAKFRQIPAIEIHEDDHVSCGSVIVEFGAGQIDGRMETQLQRIADELLVVTASTKIAATVTSSEAQPSEASGKEV